MSSSRWAILTLGVILSLCTVAANKQNPYAVGSERLVPGDYSLGSKGTFLRVVVSQGPELAYDIWRADPNGVFTHLQYTLVSPAQYPIESTHYKVLGQGKECDDLTLRLYRDDQGKAEPWIIVMRFGDYELPFGSAGRPLTATSYSDDRALVAKLRRDASNPRFYDSIPEWLRTRMLEGVPNCR